MTTSGRARRYAPNPLAAGALLAAICVLAVRIRVPEHGAVLAGALFVLHFALGLTDGLVRRRLFRIVVFAVFLFLAQLLLVRGQSVEARMASGMLMSLRFVNIVMASSLFVAATDPESLAYALMQAGLPYRYGYALVAALRFVPYLQEETATVLAAQAARGIGVDRPSCQGYTGRGHLHSGHRCRSEPCGLAGHVHGGPLLRVTCQEDVPQENTFHGGGLPDADSCHCSVGSHRVELSRRPIFLY